MKILVVDDELDVKDLFEQRFRKEVAQRLIEFAFANSGEQALRYLSDVTHEAVLILSDINMPGMSGLELLKLIKGDPGFIPAPVVMMITAYGDPESRRSAMELGADDFLTKPIDFKALKEKLNSMNHD
jgi:two-component system chemotaxis response regulator CheY